MSHYTMKSFSPQGRLVGRFNFRADNDVEAQTAMRHAADRDHDGELWCGARLVTRWSTDPPLEPAARVQANAFHLQGWRAG